MSVLEESQSNIGRVPAAPSDWEAVSLRFRYALSDLRLFTVRIQGYARMWPHCDPPPIIPRGPGTAMYESNLPVEKHLQKIETQDGWIRYALNQGYCYYIDLTGTFDHYLQSLSSKTRSTLRRKVRNFAPIDCRMYSQPDEMTEYHRLAREVAAKTYQERLFDGAIPASDGFRREMLDLASKGQVLGFILFAENRPVSYLYLPAKNGDLEYDFLGYDPAFSASSPGTVLLYTALEQIYKLGRFRRFNFGYGKNQTKEVFSTGKYLRADVYFLRTSLKHLAIIYSHAGMESCSSWCGRLTDALGIRIAIRKILRSV